MQVISNFGDFDYFGAFAGNIKLLIYLGFFDLGFFDLGFYF